MVERPLRILVIGNLPPHVLGGAENQVARLVEEWLRTGSIVEVAGHRIPTGTQALGGYDVETKRLHSSSLGGRFGRAIGYAMSLASFAIRRRNDFDVVYCRGMGDGVLTLVVLKSIVLCSWPIVACPINARGAGDVSFLRSIPGWRFFVGLIDRHVEAINLINMDIGDDLRSIGITSPSFSCIPNGVSVCQTIARASIASERRLVWTGRLGQQKGLDFLLAALAIFKQAGERFTLDLYGDGELRAELIAQAKQLGLESVVHFHGPVAVGQIRRGLEAADVFVLPSRYEGMSNSALEAMEAGLPVLCTRCGGIDAAVEDGAGWVCEPDVLDSLVECLGEMFRAPDSELLKRGLYARSLVEQKFSIEQIAARNIALLEQVASVKEAG